MLIKYSEKFNIKLLTEIYENKSSLRGISVEESLFSSSSLSLSLPFSPPFLRPNPPHFRMRDIDFPGAKLSQSNLSNAWKGHVHSINIKTCTLGDCIALIFHQPFNLQQSNSKAFSPVWKNVIFLMSSFTSLLCNEIPSVAHELWWNLLTGDSSN